MNMMTETEAKLLWCPMARFAFIPTAHGGEAATSASHNVGAKCIASACALWCWDDDEHGICRQGGTGQPYRGCCGLIRR